MQAWGNLIMKETLHEQIIVLGVNRFYYVDGSICKVMAMRRDVSHGK